MALIPYSYSRTRFLLPESLPRRVWQILAGRTVPALTHAHALHDGVLTVRASAVAALLQPGQPCETVAAPVRALAQQNDTAARSSAVFALGKATKANMAGAVEVLANLAVDSLPGPKIVALRSLGHVGDRAILPLLKESLHDRNEAVSATGAGALLHLLQHKK